MSQRPSVRSQWKRWRMDAKKLGRAVLVTAALTSASLALTFGIWGLVLLGNIGAVILGVLMFVLGVWAFYER